MEYSRDNQAEGCISRQRFPDNIPYYPQYPNVLKNIRHSRLTLQLLTMRKVMRYHHTSLFNPARKAACYGLLLLAGAASASTLDEIQALEAAKTHATSEATPAPSVTAPVTQPVSPAHLYGLPDGRQINTNDYRIVLFMQASCHFCQQFDPMLAQFSAQTGFKVFPYTLDGQGDVNFPQAIPAPRAVIDQFFGPGSKGVTPTTWLVNVNTLQSWPLAQGIVDGAALLQRINQALMSSPR